MRHRQKVPHDIETAVLAASRRRCCLCFALAGDAEEKKGQIAHLDHNPANNQVSNLAFLCLTHHDQYDAVPSQAKGITAGEVKRYRTQLSAWLSAGVMSRPGAVTTNTKRMDRWESADPVCVERLDFGLMRSPLIAGNNVHLTEIADARARGLRVMGLQVLIEYRFRRPDDEDRGDTSVIWVSCEAVDLHKDRYDPRRSQQRQLIRSLEMDEWHTAEFSFVLDDIDFAEISFTLYGRTEQTLLVRRVVSRFYSVKSGKKVSHFLIGNQAASNSMASSKAWSIL